MSIPLFELTAYELTSLIRARDVASMGARVAAIAAEQGVTAKQVLDAIWASGTITGQGARTAAVRAGAQSLARGAVHRLEHLGVQTVMRHATRQLSLRALGAVGTASMAGSAGGAAAATGMASSATAGVWSLGALVGAGLLIAVVVGAGFYFTRSGQPARTEAVDVADGALDSPPATTPGPLPTAPVADAAEAMAHSTSLDHGPTLGLDGSLVPSSSRRSRTWSLAPSPFIATAKDGERTTGSYLHRWTYTETGSSARYEKRVWKKAAHAGAAVDPLVAHYTTEARWSALPARIDGPFRIEVSARADKHVGHQIEGRHIRITADGATVRRIRQSKPHRRWDAVAGAYLAQSSATLEVTPKPGHVGRVVIRVHTDGHQAHYTYTQRR